MAEFVFWKIGADTQLLINEQAYLDYRARLEQLDYYVASQLRLVKDREPQGRLSVDGYVGLHHFNEEGKLSKIFMNVNNLEMAISHGNEHPKHTSVLMNYDDDFYYTLENAEQISCAGMCYDLHDPEDPSQVEAHERVPHIYECPVSPVDVCDENGERLSSVFADQIAIIEASSDWDSNRLVILSDMINSREQTDCLDVQTGWAKFSTQKEPHGALSYIYPSVK